MGRQFIVNQYQNNGQRESDVLALPDGGFIVVWESYYNNYNGGPAATIVSGRRYDASGRPVTDEFPIEFIDGTMSGSPSISALAGGGYAVASEFSPTDDILGATQAWVQYYDLDGTPRSPDRRVDTPTRAEEQFEAVGPRVAGTGNGGSLVFYNASQSDSTLDDIYVRRFDAQGRAVGADRLVNTRVTNRDQLEVESVTLSNGNVLAIWNSADTLVNPDDSRDYEIRGSLYSPTGALIRGDFHVSRNVGVPSPWPGLSGDFDVTPLRGGGFAVSRFGYAPDTDDPDPLFFQTFGAQGRPTSDARRVYATEEVQFDSQIVQLATGQIVVVWEQYPINGNGQEDIYGRVFARDGRALTGVFEVGVDFGAGDSQEEASLAALAGGGFVVTYTHDYLDNDDEGIAARIFGRGTAGNDVLTVDASGTLAALGGNDRVAGDARANFLAGGNGADALLGYGGADRLNGGTGRDRLTGGGGADDFVFDRRPDRGATDVVADFGRGNDEILLDNAGFRGLGTAGDLRASQFRVLGQGAVDASDRVLYDPRSGVLYHDPDGRGGVAARAFAQLSGSPDLGADAFAIV